MARAKRTDRSEARRRYRAAVAADSAGEPADQAVGEPNRLATAALPNTLGGPRPGLAGRAAKPGRPDPTLTTPPVKASRPGIFGAFSASVRPLDLRGDLRAAPAVLRDKATWIPAAITVVLGALLFVPGFAATSLGRLVLPLVIVPPPMAMPFLVGLMAPRASWLPGALVSLLGAAFYSAWILTVDVATLGGATAPVSAGDRLAAVGYALVVSIVFGAFIASFAAFYRRFLRLSSPAQNRGGSRSSRPRATTRPAARRR
ncbi:MAG TPA: hypothetical protein VF763_10885 [Candidatus Limnocylindrales bacterium]